MKKPETESALRVHGHLDAVAGQKAVGWCIYPESPDKPVAVLLRLDGHLVAEASADVFREDLKAAGIGTGKHAFEIEIPASLFDGQEHVIEVVPRDGIGALIGAPLKHELSRSSLIHGVLGQPRDMLIEGWALDAGTPEKPIDIRIEVDGESIATVTANQLRADLVTAHIGTGRHAFRFRLPARFVDSDELEIRAFTVPGNKELEHSPQTCTPAQSYDRWVRRCDTPSQEESLNRKRRGLLAVGRGAPLISVVMPVFNPVPEHLTEAIESVLRQAYPRWDLCIADDASTDKAVHEVLRSYAARDPRIKIAFRSQQGHICHASNTAIDLAQGDYVALLDHDDILPEHALLEVAEECLRHPDCRLLYSDEDKLDSDGQRFDPYFKSDWNPDLLYAHNFVSHLGIYRTEDVRAVGGFRPGYEGSQDYDLALRVFERVGIEAIRHIPKILYHWRVHDRSTSTSGDVKPYAAKAMRRALADHFKRLVVEAEVLPHLGGAAMRVRYPVPDPAPLASIIIPTRDQPALLRSCLESVLSKTTYRPLEIIIVDNESEKPETRQFLEAAQRHEAIRVLSQPGPFNFSALCNRAVEAAQGDIVVLLNDDTEVLEPEWLRELVSHAMRPEVGAVGAKLLYPDGTIQHAGVALGVAGDAGHIHKGEPGDSLIWSGRIQLIQTMPAVTGACLAVRRTLYRQSGGLDEADFPVSYNDVDFCLRLGAMGFQNVYTPHAVLTHREGASRGDDLQDDKKAARAERERGNLRERWKVAIKKDGFVNPNYNAPTERPFLAN